MGANGLARFFLVDHSLRETGGHHFDYVQCIARAAGEMGFKTTIGCHRGFRCNQFSDLRPHFRQTTYQPDSYLAGLRHLTRRRSDFLVPVQRKTNWFSRIKRSWSIGRHRRRRERFIQQFSTDCARFFHGADFRDGDHAFFTTVSELELMGLAQFLSHHPQSLQAHWHLQFHFNLFDGRTPEYEKQGRVVKMIRSCFDLAAARTPYHMLHFYATSELLADQYQRLGVGDFEVLPYPVADSFRPSRESEVSVERDQHHPLRFTCPGGIRREKGHIEYLQPLVDKIWEPHLRQGKMQLVIQRPPRKLAQGEKIKLDFPGPPSHADTVEYLPHPLPNEKYAELIRSTDCGLLFYDSRTYYSRRAGVMGELLSCGKPVIVSAGSWLAEQIKETNFQYVESIANSSLARRQLQLGDLKWNKNNVPLPGGVISFDDLRHPFELNFELDNLEAGFCIFWDWHWPRDNGVYGRVELSKSNTHPQTDQPKNQPILLAQTIGHREQRSACAIFRATDEKSIKLLFRNAFHNSMASIRNIQIVTLDAQSAETPIGTVGIVAADELQLPNCIDEMVRHYDHYRKSAGKFAHGWYSRHEPRRTVAHLMSVEQRDLRAAS